MKIAQFLAWMDGSTVVSKRWSEFLSQTWLLVTHLPTLVTSFASYLCICGSTVYVSFYYISVKTSYM